MIPENKPQTSTTDKSPSTEKGKLMTRLLSGIVIIALTVGLILAGTWPFVAFVAFLAAVSLFEWSRMVLTTQKKSIFMTSAFFAGAAIFAVAMAESAVLAALLALGLAILLRIHAGFRGISEGLDRFAGGFIYIVLSLSFLALMAVYTGKEVPGPYEAMVFLPLDPMQLKFVLITLFVVVWASDSIAYVFGRLIGGPKLAPSISPKKTWAGLLGSMCGAGGALVLAAYVFNLNFEPIFAFPALYFFFLYGAFIGVIGQIGDLLISVFKRAYNLKDTGALIPGHGGVLDRIDALILVVPFYYLGFTLIF